jgi:hypothetical protein
VRGGGWTGRRELGDPLRQGGRGLLLLAGGAVDEEGGRGGAEERGGAFEEGGRGGAEERGGAFEEGGRGGYLGFAAGSVGGDAASSVNSRGDACSEPEWAGPVRGRRLQRSLFKTKKYSNSKLFEIKNV